MRKVALRGLLAHKTRMIMTVAAVSLGVAFIAGVLTFSNTMQRSFDSLFATVYEGTDAVVRSDETVSGDFEDERGTLPDDLVDTVGGLEGVDLAAGEVEGTAQIIDKDGEVAQGGMFGGFTWAGSWDPAHTDAADVMAFDLRDGAWPESDDEIVLDAASVKRTGYSMGDTVPIQTKWGRAEYTLVGSVAFGGEESAAGSSVVLFTTSEAQRTIGEPGRISSIMVRAASGTSQHEVAEQIAGVLPDGAEVLTGKQIIDETQSDVREGLSFVTYLLLAFGIIAVVVGSFVIYNSFSIIVAQRTREMALLRAIGASRRQVRRSVFLEALAIGLVGSLLGLAMGFGLAELFRGLFLEIDGGLAIESSAIVAALSVGMVVTVLSAVWPAWRASRVPPVAAMRDVAIDRTGRSLVRSILGLLVLGIGAVWSIVAAQAEEVASVGMAIALAFLGVVLVAPALARPVAGAIGWPLSRFRGVTGRLARENAVRNPRRTASTGLALTIGVGVVAFFLVLNASIRSSFDKILDEEFAGDFIVDDGAQGMIGLPPKLGEDLAQLPEVQDAAPLRDAAARVEGSSEGVFATTSGAFDIYGMKVTSGSDALSTGEVVLKDSKADSLGVGVGDQIEIDFLDADQASLTVAGIYEASPGIDLGNYIVGLDELAQHVPNASDFQVTVSLADGVSHEAGRDALQGVVDAEFPTAEVSDSEDLKETLGSQLDVMLAIVGGLLALTILIAALGIMNTIGMSVLERTRELGLIRAVGAVTSQVRAAIRWESVIIALYGTALGMSVGVLGGWSLVRALADEGFEVFTLPWGVLAIVATFAGLLGVGAALWPAWRAGRLNVLAAIHSE